MDRITTLSMQVLDKHKDKFTTDFADNKKILDQLAIIRSKGLKNEMAGFITKFVRREQDGKDEPMYDAEEHVQETEDASIPSEITIESNEESA